MNRCVCVQCVGCEIIFPSPSIYRCLHNWNDEEEHKPAMDKFLAHLPLCSAFAKWVYSSSHWHWDILPPHDLVVDQGAWLWPMEWGGRDIAPILSLELETFVCFCSSLALLSLPWKEQHPSLACWSKKENIRHLEQRHPTESNLDGLSPSQPMATWPI